MPGGGVAAGVAALAAWMPGVHDAQAWRNWAGGVGKGADEGPWPQPRAVDAMLRRRLTPLARVALALAEDVLPAGQTAPMVFASRHGELSRTLELLGDIAQDEPLSPTTFSLSVHNALTGVWSIARRDRAASLALAAGEESFTWGLVEAMVQAKLRPGQEIVFLYADDPMPGPYQAFAAYPSPPLALAMRLVAQGEGDLEMVWADAPESCDEAAALAFLRGWFGPDDRFSWHGQGRLWTWSRHAHA